jgi:hypothetical protein
MKMMREERERRRRKKNRQPELVGFEEKDGVGGAQLFGCIGFRGAGVNSVFLDLANVHNRGPEENSTLMNHFIMEQSRAESKGVTLS